MEKHLIAQPGVELPLFNWTPKNTCTKNVNTLSIEVFAGRFTIADNREVIVSIYFNNCIGVVFFALSLHHCLKCIVVNAINTVILARVLVAMKDGLDFT